MNNIYINLNNSLLALDIAYIILLNPSIVYMYLCFQIYALNLQWACLISNYLYVSINSDSKFSIPLLNTIILSSSNFVFVSVNQTDFIPADSDPKISLLWESPTNKVLLLGIPIVFATYWNDFISGFSKPIPSEIKIFSPKTYLKLKLLIFLFCSQIFPFVSIPNFL